MSTWAWILIASVGCYALKLAGQLVPASVRENKFVAEIVELVPVALLGALIAGQVFTTGHDLVVDVRAIAFVVAGALVMVRAPFLVVVLGSALCAALLRLPA